MTLTQKQKTRLYTKRRVTLCPPPCGRALTRKDSRHTEMPRILKLRLYYCAAGHQIESAETIVGDIVPIRRKKLLINTHSVRREEGRDRANDYAL